MRKQFEVVRHRFTTGGVPVVFPGGTIGGIQPVLVGLEHAGKMIIVRDLSLYRGAVGAFRPRLFERLGGVARSIEERWGYPTAPSGPGVLTVHDLNVVLLLDENGCFYMSASSDFDIPYEYLGHYEFCAP